MSIIRVPSHLPIPLSRVLVVCHLSGWQYRKDLRRLHTQLHTRCRLSPKNAENADYLAPNRLKTLYPTLVGEFSRPPHSTTLPLLRSDSITLGETSVAHSPLVR
jgi:hypothetical protein